MVSVNSNIADPYINDLFLVRNMFLLQGLAINMAISWMIDFNVLYLENLLI